MEVGIGGAKALLGRRPASFVASPPSSFTASSSSIFHSASPESLVSSPAFYLEQQTDHVYCYARNDRPFLLIPYEYEGVPHHYEPDYIVRLKNGKFLLLEVKGEEDEQDRAKYQAARRWIAAVNNWGRLGAWDFMVCRNPQTLPKMIAEV